MVFSQFVCLIDNIILVIERLKFLNILISLVVFWIIVLNIGKISLTRNIIKSIQRVRFADKCISRYFVAFNTLVSFFLSQMFEFFRTLGISTSAIFGRTIADNPKEVFDIRSTIFVINIIRCKDFLTFNYLGIGHVVLNSSVRPSLGNNTTDISCVFNIKNTFGYWICYPCLSSRLPAIKHVGDIWYQHTCIGIIGRNSRIHISSVNKSHVVWASNPTNCRVITNRVNLTDKGDIFNLAIFINLIDNPRNVIITSNWTSHLNIFNQTFVFKVKSNCCYLILTRAIDVYIFKVDILNGSPIDNIEQWVFQIIDGKTFVTITNQLTSKFGRNVWFAVWNNVTSTHTLTQSKFTWWISLNGIDQLSKIIVNIGLTSFRFLNVVAISLSKMILAITLHQIVRFCSYLINRLTINCCLFDRLDSQVSCFLICRSHLQVVIREILRHSCQTSLIHFCLIVILDQICTCKIFKLNLLEIQLESLVCQDLTLLTIATIKGHGCCESIWLVIV